MPKKRKAKKTDNAVLPVMRPNAAGIDIGSTEMYVAVPADRDAENVRSFPTFTQDLYQLADWLKRCEIETCDGIHRRVLDSSVSDSRGAWI